MGEHRTAEAAAVCQAHYDEALPTAADDAGFGSTDEFVHEYLKRGENTAYKQGRLGASEGLAELLQLVKDRCDDDQVQLALKKYLS